MGDIAHILGVPLTTTRGDGVGPPPPAPAGAPRSAKLQRLSNEVVKLIGVTAAAAATSSSHSDAAMDLPTSVPASGYAAAALQTPASAGAAMNHNDAVVKVGNKWISASKPARPWVWAPFSSSARTDGLLLHHWVRNVEYPDYPYARFDIHLDPVTYQSDEEYRSHLQNADWSKSETDQLLELARRFELRWPVIYDRWIELFDYGGGTTLSDLDTPRHRKIEDLQHRYYSVAAILLQRQISHEAASEAQSLASQTATQAAAAAGSDAALRTATSTTTTDALLVETAAARALAAADPQHQPVLHNVGAGASNKLAFDLNYERERRCHMEGLWNRTKEEEIEEAELRRELKLVEAQLRKMKKSGAHLVAGAGSRPLSSAASSRNASRAATPVPVTGGGGGGGGGGIIGGGDPAAVSTLLDQAFVNTAPTAVAGTPYLQSGRLLSPAFGGDSGVNKSLLSRMDEVLDEMGVAVKPLPSKRVCDLYDTVRKDVLILLTLQKAVLQKEGLIASRRLKLAKRSGNGSVVDEETLLGIVTQASPSAHSTASRAGTKVARGKKSESGGSFKSRTSSKPKTGDTALANGGGGGSGAAASGSSAVRQVPAIPTSGVKQARKPAAPGVKRKRKSGDAGQKPPAPISGSGGGVGESIAAPAPPAAVASTAALPIVEGATTAISRQPGAGAGDTKPPGGKKRAKKSAT